MKNLQINFKDPIWLIFLGALFLRIMGVAWGLPNELRAFSLHPDEQVNLLFARQINPGQLDFTPGAYNYGTLYLTILRVISDVIATYAGGIDQSGNMSPALMGQIHLAGRFLNCLLGAGLASLVFGIGRRHFSKSVGLFAGIATAVAPALVVHSRFQTVDMLATLLAVASVGCALRLLIDETPVMKYVVWSAVFAGLSAGTKYVGIVAIISLLPALWFRDRNKIISYFPLALAVAIVTFVITTPGCIVDREAFMRDFTFELNHSKEGHGIVFAATSPSLLYHFGNLMLGLGILGTFLGLSGMVLGIVKRDKAVVVLAGFFVIYLLAVSGGQIKFMRYVLPLIPVLALGIGVLVHQVNLIRPAWAKGVMLLSMLGIAGLDRGGFVGAGTLSTQMLLPDPRDEAGKWIKSKGDVSVALAGDPWFWSPSIHPEVPVTRMMGPNRLRELWSTWTNPRLVRYQTDDRFDWDARTLTELKPDYVAFSSFEYAPIERMKLSKVRSDVENLFVSRYDQYLAVLSTGYVIAWDNDPAHVPMVEDMEYVHPRVVIWKRKGL